MKAPFSFDGYVTGKDFIGRRRDCDVLSSLIDKGKNVYMRESPKSGKTSVIRQTLFERRLQGDQTVVCDLSLMGVRRPVEFVKRFGEVLIKAVATNVDEYKECMGMLPEDSCYVFDDQGYAEHGQIVSFGSAPRNTDVDAMVRLPWKIAEKKDIKILMILDFFDEILEYDDARMLLDSIEGALADHATMEDNTGAGCTFLFCGSRVNAMKHIFEDAGHWFRGTVRRVKLSPISGREISEHMMRGFISGGKVIDKEMIVNACETFRDDIWYVNQFFYICDSLSRGYIVEATFSDALDCMISLHSLRFRVLTDSLTAFQVAMLRAICDGVTQFTSAETIDKYKLSSSANVKRLRESLMKKEIIAFDDDDRLMILDSLFEYWLKHCYFV